MKNFRYSDFLLLPVLILLILFSFSIFKKNDKDIDYTRNMINAIKKTRIAIDEYYLKTGSFPELNKTDELKDIYYKNIENEIISFKEVYGEKHLIKTPTYKNLTASNEVHIVEKFDKVTNNGGWNYNIKTGEIHLNLPSNFFEQGIDWNSF